jgi:hypothetical protein
MEGKCDRNELLRQDQICILIDPEVHGDKIKLQIPQFISIKPYGEKICWLETFYAGTQGQNKQGSTRD